MFKSFKTFNHFALFKPFMSPGLSIRQIAKVVQWVFLEVISRLAALAVLEYPFLLLQTQFFSLLCTAGMACGRRVRCLRWRRDSVRVLALQRGGSSLPARYS
jgi:hypothetical protein